MLLYIYYNIKIIKVIKIKKCRSLTELTVTIHKAVDFSLDAVYAEVGGGVLARLTVGL